jgi:hypothetical protein
MVAAEAPFLLQAHRLQGGGYGPLAGREDRTREQQLDVLPMRSENSGAKGVNTRIIVVGRVRISITSFVGSVTSLPYSLHP